MALMVSLPAAARRALLFGACLLFGCATGLEGRSCVEGMCPEDEICGPDEVCRARCQVGSCPIGFSCDQEQGFCVEEGIDPVLDSHGAVGTILLAGQGSARKCLGTLAAPSWVLTSARCLGDSPVLQVVFSDDSVGITSVLVHPAFEGGDQPDGDLALLELSAPQSMAPIPIAEVAPEPGLGLYAVVPARESTADEDRYLIPITVQEVEPLQYRFSSVAMTSPFSCPTSGGPSFTATDELVGLHSRSPCEEADFIDLRADAYRAWIAAQIGADP